MKRRASVEGKEAFLPFRIAGMPFRPALSLLLLLILCLGWGAPRLWAQEGGSGAATPPAKARPGVRRAYNPVTSPSGPIATLDDLNGRRLGALAGSSMDISVSNRLDYTQIVYYDDYAAMIEALKAEEIDAIVHDEPVAKVLAAANPTLRMLPELLDKADYAFAVNYGDNSLYEAADGVIRANLKNGGMGRLVAEWVDGPPTGKAMSAEEAPPSLPPLRLGTYPDLKPFTYRDRSDRVVGLDIELALQMASRLNRRLEIVPMEFSELIPSLIRRDVDVIGSCIIVTEARAKLVHFTEVYYRGGVAALVRNETAAGGGAK